MGAGHLEKQKKRGKFKKKEVRTGRPETKKKSKKRDSFSLVACFPNPPLGDKNERGRRCRGGGCGGGGWRLWREWMEPVEGVASLLGKLIRQVPALLTN